MSIEMERIGRTIVCSEGIQGWSEMSAKCARDPALADCGRRFEPTVHAFDMLQM